MSNDDQPDLAGGRTQAPGALAEGEVREGSAVLLVDGQGRVLLQQRDDPVPPMGVGRWAIPGGGREGDEDALTTARREFEEETGVRLELLRLFGVYEPGRDRWMRRFRLSLFIAQDDVPRDAISVYEGMDFQYHTPEDALALPLNPSTRRHLEEALGSGMYRAAAGRKATGTRWSTVVSLDRWGRALLVQPGDGGRAGTWCLPGALARPGESPDRTAFRAFREATGHTLEALKLYGVVRQAGELPSGPAAATHVYFDDPDLAIEDLELPEEGGTAAYAGPDEVDGFVMMEYARATLERFFVSPAYRAMFH